MIDDVVIDNLPDTPIMALTITFKHTDEVYMLGSDTLEHAYLYTLDYTTFDVTSFK